MTKLCLSLEHAKSWSSTGNERINLRLILGNAYGAVAPASVFSDTFYTDLALQPVALMPLTANHEDRGLHILEGSISVAGETFSSRSDDDLPAEDSISVAAGPF